MLKIRHQYTIITKVKKMKTENLFVEADRLVISARAYRDFCNMCSIDGSDLKRSLAKIREASEKVLEAQVILDRSWNSGNKKNG